MAIDHVIYLYDPLCGWCYGSLPAIHALLGSGSCLVEPLPSGLFAGDPARRIGAAAAQHIEQADARIAGMSGQPFTDTYRQQVLGNPELPFDSGPATHALSAVARWEAPREIEALHALQRERFVMGRDLTQPAVIAAALAGALGDTADVWLERLAVPDLPAMSQLRIRRARQLMNTIGVQGVPTLLWPSEQGLRPLPGQWMFDGKPIAERLAALG